MDHKELQKLAKRHGFTLAKSGNLETLRDTAFKRMMKKHGVKYSDIPTRFYLEKMLPCFKEPVLFLGWAVYTAQYAKIIPMISVDYNPVTKPDIVADVTNKNLLTKLADYRREHGMRFRKFNTIVVNGVIGWGVNEDPAIDRCLKNCSDLLKANGKLLIGWNTKKTEGSSRVIKPDEMSKILKRNKFRNIEFLEDTPEDPEWQHKYYMCRK